MGLAFGQVGEGAVEAHNFSGGISVQSIHTKHGDNESTTVQRRHFIDLYTVQEEIQKQKMAMRNQFRIRITRMTIQKNEEEEKEDDNFQDADDGLGAKKVVIEDTEVVEKELKSKMNIASKDLDMDSMEDNLDNNSNEELASLRDMDENKSMNGEQKNSVEDELGSQQEESNKGMDEGGNMMILRVSLVMKLGGTRSFPTQQSFVNNSSTMLDLPSLGR